LGSRERVGVRIALGATPGGLIRYVVGTAVVPVFYGVAFGSIGSFVAVRSLSPMLFGVRGFDVPSLLSTVTLLILAAGVALLGPIACTLRLQPADVLKMLD